MEMLHEKDTPTCACKTSGMEEEYYGYGEEESLHRQNTLIQLLQQREKRLTRIVQILAVAFLTVASTAVILLVLLLGARAQPVDCQSMKSDDHRYDNNSRTEAKGQKQEMEDMYPGIMLTRPEKAANSDTHLTWGHSQPDIPQGGFSHSGESITVPKDGRYKVYLQITYLISEHCEDMELQNFVYYNIEGYDKEILLLQSMDKADCGINKSLYTAGTFQLSANTRLWVTSTQPQIISKIDTRTFFGVDLVSHVSVT